MLLDYTLHLEAEVTIDVEADVLPSCREWWRQGKLREKGEGGCDCMCTGQAIVRGEDTLA